MVSKNSGIIDVLCYFQVFIKVTLKSVRMETAKRVRYVMYGMMSVKGTDEGRLRNVGSRAVRTGMDSVMFDGWRWNSNRASFVLNMIVMDVRKRVYSMKMLVRLMNSTPKPYQSEAMGQSSCMPAPVR